MLADVSRSRRFQLTEHPNLLQVVAVVIFLFLWEYFGRSVDPIFMSHPSKIAAAFSQLIDSGEMQNQLLASLLIFAVGLAASIVLGVLFGVVMGRYRVMEYLLDPFVNALYCTPLVALIPLIILWFGLGLEAKTLIIFLSAVFPIIINTYQGVHDVSSSLVEVAKAYSANERQVLTKVVLPAAVPFIAAGVRIGLGRAVVGMVVAEMFTALTGLGSMLVVYANTFATDKMFVPIVLLCLIGIVLTEGSEHLERVLARWKQTERA